MKKKIASVLVLILLVSSFAPSAFAAKATIIFS
jgi:hypothetical protein